MQPETQSKVTDDPGQWPNLFVIGAHKAGTTSFHNYLDTHPDIQMSADKETSYFSGPTSDVRLISRWDRGSCWYKSNFLGSERVHGESSTSYTNYPHTKGVPERIHKVCPEARLIYLVRDPVSRLISHYQHVRGLGRERRSLESIIAADDASDSAYIARSCYWMQLSQYLKYFAEQQIKVISFTELTTDREATLAQVFMFLGVDSSFTAEEWDQAYNKAHRFPMMETLGRVLSEPMMYSVTNDWRGARRLLTMVKRPQRPAPALSPFTRERLHALLSDDAAKLRAFTSQSFSDWSV
jgi:hypothetical protein